MSVAIPPNRNFDIVTGASAAPAHGWSGCGTSLASYWLPAVLVAFAILGHIVVYRAVRARRPEVPKGVG